jgi:hypothetical protein
MLRSRIAAPLLAVLPLICFFTARPLHAQTPYFVFSVQSADELLGDIGHITSGGGKTQGPSPIDQMILQFTGGKGLAGVDKGKPFGLYVASPKNDGGPPQIVVWIPVKNASEFLGLFRVSVPPGGAEGRPFSLNLGGRQAFGRVSSGHCFIAMEPDALERAAVPRGRAAGKHDLGLEVDFSQVSEEDRTKFLNQLTSRLDERQEFARGESEAYQRGQQFGRQIAMESVRRAIEESEQLSLGVSFERSSGNFTLDYELTARSGTKLAADCDAFGSGTSSFAALASTDAAVSLVCVTRVTDEIRQLASQFSVAEEAAHAEIDASRTFNSAAARETAHDGMASFAKAFRGLEQLDVALILDRNPAGKLHFVAAGKLGSGKEFANFIEKVVKSDPTTFGIRSVKLDAASHGGARIHALTLEPELEKVLGPGAAHLGLRGDSIYVAAGGDSLSALKTALDKTSSRPPRRPPLSVHVRPSKLLDLIARGAPALRVEKARQAFQGQGDFASLEMVPAPRGVKMRVTLGSAFLRLIWSSLPQGNGMNPAPGPGPRSKGPRGRG